jgi:hypothetical protein
MGMTGRHDGYWVGKSGCQPKGHGAVAPRVGHGEERSDDLSAEALAKAEANHLSQRVSSPEIA